MWFYKHMEGNYLNSKRGPWDMYVLADLVFTPPFISGLSFCTSHTHTLAFSFIKKGQ